MKILVLSFYYSPDLCAGSFRTTALVEQLTKIDGTEIEVVTTLPNRYASFSAEALEHESNDGINIHRIALPSHNSGMLDQIRAFVTYYRKALKIVKTNEYDLVFATSSRLFTAFLGARIANKKKVPLYLDIRDIFVDTIKDVLPKKITWLIKPVFSLIERYSFGRAERINLVSKGFIDYFNTRFPDTQYRCFTNGIDKEFIAAVPEHVEVSNANQIPTVLYAGNIGEGQGLQNILPNLAKKMEGRVVFKVIGDGGRRKVLQDYLVGVKNVEILPPLDRADLIQEYQKADVLFLHLNDYDAFRKVLPSKIFEYAALGKPIWAGVSGYAAEFLNTEVTNSSVFSPGDEEQAQASFERLELSVTPRPDFVEKFSREKIMSEMATDIINLVKCND